MESEDVSEVSSFFDPSLQPGMWQFSTPAIQASKLQSIDKVNLAGDLRGAAPPDTLGRLLEVELKM